MLGLCIITIKSPFPFVEEDVYGGYAKIIKKLFLSEGVVNGHSLFLHSGPLGHTQSLKALIKVLDTCGGLAFSRIF